MYQEYKGSVEETGKFLDPPLKVIDGMINVPTGPGFGISNTNDIFKKAEFV
jgi:hypothetical protein